MAELITEEQPRVKFGTHRIGGDIPRSSGELAALCELQHRLEAEGVIPVLNDGLVGGNCAITAACAGGDVDGAAPELGRGLLVSRSGKPPGALLRAKDFVLVTSFDRSSWSATYRSAGAAARPSSDLPLHWHALAADCQTRYGWGESPAPAGLRAAA